MDIRRASQTCFLLRKEKIRRRYGIFKKEIPRFLIAHSRGEPWDIRSRLCQPGVGCQSLLLWQVYLIFFCLVHVYRFGWSGRISFRSRELRLHDDLAGNQTPDRQLPGSRGECLFSTFLKGTDYLQPFSSGSPQAYPGMCWWAVHVGSNPLGGCSAFRTEKVAMISIVN